MRLLLSLLLTILLGAIAIAPGALAYQSIQDLPTGTLARGNIDPVPSGNLSVGVLDETLPVGGWTQVGGPPGFLLAGDETLKIEGVPGASELKRGTATFLPRGGGYRLTNMGAKPARFRFVGLGAAGEVKGAHYEMEPMPWGPGSGKTYYVTLDRSRFPANSSTPWHFHTGPAFGILDDGEAWENRQVDGTTRFIQTPGYYIQPAEKDHQLSQVGKGGYALIFQFAPTGQSLTGGGPARGDKTPTVLTQATAIPTADGKPIGTPEPTPLVQPTAKSPAGETQTTSGVQAGSGGWIVVTALGIALLVGGAGFVWTRRRQKGT